MRSKTFFINRIIKYIYIFHLIIRTFCFEEQDQWTYSQCKNYLNDLDIFCYKIIKKNDGTEFCQKWNYINISSAIFLPIECYNKNYNLNLIIQNTNPPVKKKLNMKLENEENTFFFDMDQNTFQLLSDNYYPEMQKCMNDFAKYEEECGLNKPLDENEKKKCNEFWEKHFNTPMCFNLIKQFESKIEPFINEKLSQFYENNEIDFDLSDQQKNIDYYIDCFYGDKIEDNNYIDYEEENVEEKRYFSNVNKKKNNDDEDNELENNYKNSGKDCVEYGLKSLKEEILVCTKYE